MRCSRVSLGGGGARLQPGLLNLSAWYSAFKDLGFIHTDISGGIIRSPVPTEGPE